ncbi:hypothetical protein C0989_006438 [Termitomyces sp. Mn162]|nr:hypothetical protein C0989_006438 [Termitomyces sp. Mn162]
MEPSGEDSADLARIQPASVLSPDGTTSAPPRISVDSPGLLATAHPVPTFILSPIRIPPLVTSPARASSPLSAATDPSSPASRPLSPKKAARRRASKCPALAPAHQLSIDTADTFLRYTLFSFLPLPLPRWFSPPSCMLRPPQTLSLFLEQHLQTFFGGTEQRLHRLPPGSCLIISNLVNPPFLLPYKLRAYSLVSLQLTFCTWQTHSFYVVTHLWFTALRTSATTTSWPGAYFTLCMLLNCGFTSA